MRTLLLLLLLGGCATEGGQPPSFDAHVHGVYTGFAGGMSAH